MPKKSGSTRSSGDTDKKGYIICPLCGDATDERGLSWWAGTFTCPECGKEIHWDGKKVDWARSPKKRRKK